MADDEPSVPTNEELAELLERIHLVDLEPRVEQLRRDLITAFEDGDVERIGRIKRLLAVIAPAADLKRAELFPPDVDRNAGPSS